MTNDLMAVMQQHLDGAPLDQTLTRLTEEDPQLAAVAQLLAQREQSLEADLEQQEREDEEERLRAAEEESRRQVTQRLHEHIEALTGELERLRQSVEILGLGLGACPSCLGTDAECPLCHGRGLPGSLPPTKRNSTGSCSPPCAHGPTRRRAGAPMTSPHTKGVPDERVRRRARVPVG